MQPFDSQRAQQLAAIKAHEQQIYAQAKGMLADLEPRLKMTKECLDRIQAGLTEYDSATGGGAALSLQGVVTLLQTILDVQRFQLEQAETEAETGISNAKKVVSQIEAKVRPGYHIPPTGGM